MNVSVGTVAFLRPAILLALMFFGSIAHCSPASAHAVGVSLSGFGTATIDGTFGPGEWDKAAQISFLANAPLNDGGGTTPVTLFVMNDATNLYLALKIIRSSFGGATNPSFEFDNNHNGIVEEGDDLFGMFVGIFSPPQFIDGFRTSQPPCPLGLCGLRDSDFGGTNDGTTAATNNGQFTLIELLHPLDGGDHLHDFALHPGNTVGFALSLTLFSLNPSCNNAPNCGAATDFPAGAVFPLATRFGDIVIASPATVPVPAALILLGFGLVELGLLGRRRRRRAASK